MQAVEGTGVLVSATEREAGFAEFYTATRARMFRVAYGVTTDRAAAEDAVQSAYAKAFARWSRVSRADDPSAYLRRMVINEVLGVRRRSWWRAERLTEPADLPHRTDEQVIDAVVNRQWIWEAVKTLPPGQRAVIVLRYYEDLSEGQIAAALGCSRGTVKSQAAAALRRLGADIGFEEGLS